MFNLNSVKFFSQFRLIDSTIFMRFDVSEVTQVANELLCLVFVGTCLKIMLSKQLYCNSVMISALLWLYELNGFYMIHWFVASQFAFETANALKFRSLFVTSSRRNSGFMFRMVG